ncbi:AcrR family transcriptional regulator [Rhizobium leguminosarum]|uniref:AcrR family transcriptional regulator n=1 Tax=Rhizobium leguminosarum TaxID=384 RepID=A0AAE2MH46_RHILE|nr:MULTISPECIES: TetR family transcriptional regulator [Rhizobium]MBB4289005.1 AcrR family transcriptional regulator [Rhizobium leguminosarum]MBB4294902.1 AcrR family transcriptional regulator [Rhizobium leguminosarum]MBB4306295.1 AcrR family transcriptional regulator [Rhizobium leguminosarum]MBB4418124.1 AcrR family transcriptional regulator [Rhizobium leguminosarum]MBB4432969.1 AcrR family transcriptional regulator [Rhizobium esperanzae]
MKVGTTVKNQPQTGYISSIVEAGTAACRLYGPTKTNVVDIARLLGKSPASVYKIFPSKAAIWDAIAGNFFETDLRFTPSADGELTSAASRLKETALGQHRLMLQARDGDSQMFSLAVLAAERSWPSFKGHLNRLTATVGELVSAGIATEEFVPRNVDAAASCFCLSIISLWDPRFIGAQPLNHCELSAQELASFAVAALGQVPPRRGQPGRGNESRLSRPEFDGSAWSEEIA